MSIYIILFSRHLYPTRNKMMTVGQQRREYMRLVSRQYRSNKTYKFADHSRKILPKTMILQHQRVAKMLKSTHIISVDGAHTGFREEDRHRMQELESRFTIGMIVTYRKFVKAREIERFEAIQYLKKQKKSCVRKLKDCLTECYMKHGRHATAAEVSISNHHYQRSNPVQMIQYIFILH